MADEITINASLVYDDDKTDATVSVTDRKVSPATLLPLKFVQSIGTSEEVIKLGELATLGMCMFKNLDPTNYVDLKVATGGAIFARLHPDTNGDGKGGVALLYMGSGAQAPFAIANTGACRVEVELNPQ